MLENIEINPSGPFNNFIFAPNEAYYYPPNHPGRCLLIFLRTPVLH